MEKYLHFGAAFCMLGCLVFSGNHAFKIGSLREGEVCYKDKTALFEVHVCKPKKNCSTMGNYTVHSSEPDLSAACGTVGSEPMVCCPVVTKPKNDTTISPQKVTSNSYFSASKMCDHYSNLHYKKPENYSESFQNRAGKVFGGDRAKPAEFPHMAYLECLGPRESWSCGGSLISHKWILSAAHCAFSDNDVVMFWAKLGYTNIDDPKLRRNGFHKIAYVVVHPSYDDIRIFNDIALFRLAEAVEFSTFVRPICLNTDPSLKFQKATVTGWGLYDKNGQQSSSELLKGEVNYVSNKDCNLSFENVDKSTVVCAKGDSVSGIGVTCQGDSGGPLQVRNATAHDHVMYTAIGLTSFGKEHCGGGTPVAFTRVSYYADWIASIVWPKKIVSKIKLGGPRKTAK